jgi:hypothetical protein
MICEPFQVNWTTFFSFVLVTALHQVLQGDAVMSTIEWWPTRCLIFHSFPIGQRRIAASFSLQRNDEHDRVVAKTNIDEFPEW